MSRPNLEALAAEYQRRFDLACVAEQEPEFRNHLGASAIGQECTRAIWYGFRWIAKVHARQAIKKLKEAGYVGENLEDAAKGCAARIFSTGHNEEPHFYRRLEAAGFQFEAKQEKLKLFGGHYGGTNDGRIYLPELEASAILELKTMNLDNFDKLVKRDKKGVFVGGIQATKIGYFKQVQSYMQELGVKYCLFIVLSKNDSRTHFEIIEADEKVGQEIRKRALLVINEQRPPMRISDDASYYKCKFCDYYDQCHNAVPSEVNCRSCCEAHAAKDGWHCARFNKIIPKEFLEKGCPQHRDIAQRATT